MLKFLRKYNTHLLVGFGVVLMMAFLLPQTIQELGRQRASGSAMRMAGRKVPLSALQQADREHRALLELTNRALPALGGGETTEHWVMLVHEAQKAGLIGGAGDGAAFLQPLAERVAAIAASQNPFTTPEQFQQMTAQFRTYLDQVAPRVQAEFKLDTQEFNHALAKLRGVMRLRDGYLQGARLSDRRLINQVKTIADEVTIDYVFIPGEREALSDPEPSEAEILAQFEKHRSDKKAESTSGLGYYQPDRITLAWMTFRRDQIAAIVTPDPVEVQKRFLKRNPTGQPPAGQTMEQAKQSIFQDVRNELTDKVLRAAEQTLRGEFDRVVRKLPIDGDFRLLPPGPEWETQRPDFNQLSVTIAQRVRELTGVNMPVPSVDLRRGGFLSREDVGALAGIGTSFLRRGGATVPFTDIAFRVKEIVGTNDLSLQAGIPSVEPTTDYAGNKYYFMVIDARKAAPPTDPSEVRAEVANDIRRINGFARLATQAAAKRAVVIEKGLAAIGEPVELPPGDTRIQLNTKLPVQKAKVTFAAVTPGDASSNGRGDPRINDEETRRAIMAFADAMDPTIDPATLAPDLRTFAIPVKRALGLLVGQVTTLGPVTQEGFRTMQSGMVGRVIRDELKLPENDPFSLKAMEQRLGVEYLDGRTKRPDAEPAKAG